MGQKRVFSQMILDHLGCTNKRNEPIWSPLQAILATPKSQNALKMGCFGTKNGSKMDPKCVFSQMILTIWGAQTSEMSPFRAHCKPFGPSKVTRCLENGLFWDQKWVKNVLFERYFWTIWGAQTS